MMTAGFLPPVGNGDRGGPFGASLTLSRRHLLQLAALAGGASALGLSGCATPTGLPGQDTYNIALNRSLVSLDNKLNQFDAAVTV
jgi:peptide/nickel transport system substrate-binding protein